MRLARRTRIRLLAAAGAMCATALPHVATTAVVGASDSTAGSTVYTQTLMDRCLLRRNVSFGYRFGPLKAFPLLHLRADPAVTGTILLSDTALLPGQEVIGDASLYFMKSPALAKTDATSLQKRSAAVGLAEWQAVTGNVVVQWSADRRSPLRNQTLTACLRASRLRP